MELVIPTHFDVIRLTLLGVTLTHQVLQCGGRSVSEAVSDILRKLNKYFIQSLLTTTTNWN